MSPSRPLPALLKLFKFDLPLLRLSDHVFVWLLRSQAVVRCANLGDSGFRLVRDGRILLRSPQQEHTFGCPYQLGHHATSNVPGVRLSRLTAWCTSVAYGLKFNEHLLYINRMHK